MRKIRRVDGDARKGKSGPDRRSAKPGFRPKGNNAGSPRTRKSADENDGDREESRRPRTTGRSRSESDSRPGRSSSRSTGPRSGSFRERPSGGDDRGERTRSGPYRGDREDRGERSAGPRGRTSGGDDRGERTRSGPYRGNREDRGERSAGPRSGSYRGRSSGGEDRGERTSSESYRGRGGEGSDRAERTRSGPYRGNREDRGERSAGPRSGSYRGRTSEGADRGERTRSGPYRSNREERGERSSSPRGPRSGGRSSSESRGSSPRKSGYDKAQRGNFSDRTRKPQGKRSSSGSEAAVSGQTRLNKYIANCGICSRREADDLIKAGVISVNGHIITEMGYKLNPGDEVRYNNAILRGEKPVYLLLNKPKDYITTVDDPGQRHTVMELISGACSERVYPVGRLDRNTTGVLLFTNDGDLARKLMHPSFHVQKVYHVSLDGAFKSDEMERVIDGIHLEDGPIKVDDIAYAGDGADRKEVGVELHSGRNRIVRRIFEFFGHKVVKLDRTVFAGLTKKDLPRGRWRFLNEMEVNRLKMLVGDKRLKREGKKSERAVDYVEETED